MADIQIFGMYLRDVVQWLLLVYLTVINVISVIMCVSDKIRAKKNKTRVPEARLMLFSALGGSVLMFITMLIIRHKTKHVKFMLGIPAIILMQLCVLYLVLI